MVDDVDHLERDAVGLERFARLGNPARGMERQIVDRHVAEPRKNHRNQKPRAGIIGIRVILFLCGANNHADSRLDPR